MAFYLHFTHLHRLTLNEDVHIDDLIVCAACEKYCSGPTYSCDICKFNLEDSCAHLDPRYSSPFHPHELHVITPPKTPPAEPWFKCNACFRDCGGFAYGCEGCNLYLHVECALLRPTVKEDEDQILKHLIHYHPLVLVTSGKEKGIDKDLGCCRLCREFISSAPIYKCEPCGFFLHQSCAELELPPTLNHFYHGDHSLTRCTEINTTHKCNACSEIPDSVDYLCRECDFRLDLGCALLPDKMKSQGDELHYHSVHGHPLVLTDIDLDVEQIQCVACGDHCFGQTYVCRWVKNKCKFFLHQSCFLLPTKTYHTYQPCRHQLTMTYQPFPKVRCSVCYKFCNGLFYHCADCSLFNLHVTQCPPKLSLITYNSHRHNLVFVENMAEELNKDNQFEDPKCHACGKDCKASACLFRCPKCDFNLHLEFGPLPCTIEDKDRHSHPLKLTNSPVEEDGERKFDTDVFYCDECEQERDPRLPVYYCSEGCPYIAEIKCVISEVMLSLTGKYGNVGLRSGITGIPGKVIGCYCVHENAGQDNVANDGKDDFLFYSTTGDKIISSFTEQDRWHYQSVSKAARKRTWNGAADHQSTESSSNSLSFANEAHALMKLLYTKDKEDDQEIFKVVDDHFVLWDCTFIWHNLEKKYGAIITESSLPESMVRSYFLFVLCWTIHSMCTTRVVDIRQDLLFRWWEGLKLLQFVGIKVQFALDRLNKVVLGYYGLRVKDIEKEKVEEIDSEITKVSKHIQELELALAKERARLVALKERRDHVMAKETLNSSLVDECLRQGTELKWRIAGEGLLDL